MEDEIVLGVKLVQLSINAYIFGMSCLLDSANAASTSCQTFQMAFLQYLEFWFLVMTRT